MKIIEKYIMGLISLIIANIVINFITFLYFLPFFIFVGITYYSFIFFQWVVG